MRCGWGLSPLGPSDSQRHPHPNPPSRAGEGAQYHPGRSFCDFTPTMTSILTTLFDGVAYGMLLFVLACGLAVTLGLMNFVNLAHGAFAMAGGYICAVLVNRSGWPFFAGLPLAFVSAAVIGAALER